MKEVGRSKKNQKLIFKQVPDSVIFKEKKPSSRVLIENVLGVVRGMV